MNSPLITPYEITEAMLLAAFPVLTERESQVLRWILHGKTDTEIAGILEISTPTASTHVHNILTKLDVINRILAFGEVVCVIICRRPPATRSSALVKGPGKRTLGWSC